MANTKKAADFIDFHSLLRTYASKWYYFVISVFLCVALGFVVVRKSERPMAVRANILITQENDSPLAASSATMGGLSSLFGSSAYVEDEVFVISSHSLFREVAKTLQLNKIHRVKSGFLKSYTAYPQFPVDVDAPGIADTLKTTLIFNIKVDRKGLADIKVKAEKKVLADLDDITLPHVIKTEYGDFTVTPTSTFPKGQNVKTVVYFSGYETAAEDLTESIDVGIASRKSNVIELAYDTPNPDLGSAVLNEILIKYNERGLAERNLQGENTGKFLQERLALLATDLQDAESAIQAYKEGHGIIDVEAEAEYQTTKKGALETALIEQETEYEIMKMTRDYFSDPAHRNDLVPMAVASEGMQAAIAAYNDLMLKRMELMQGTTPDNYAVKQLSQQIDASRENLRISTDRLLESTRVKLDDLRKEKAKTDSRLSNIPTQEREFINMQRQMMVKQELYLFLLQRQEENSLLLANAVSKGKIIDEAYVLSEPLGMSPKLILVVFFIIGLLIPPAIIYLRKIIRNKFESRSEVERRITAPILGEICVDKSGRSLVVTERDTSSTTELFRLLRSNLQFLLSNAGDKVILMTSTRSGEGKSFISLNLAASLALLDNKKVLLVGMDIRNPQLSNYLDIDPPLGLTNYLASDKVTLDQIIVPMKGYARFDVIVAGPIPPNPAELLMSDKVDALFAQLRERYDFIVVDTAPVGMVSDTFTLDRISDVTVYVTRLNYSSMQDLDFIQEIYDGNRLKRTSVVINGAHSKKGYGYGYGAKNTVSKR
ncbi:MAG: polysaccharide biosynthesis tyrosine autokinase [Duncaniella sp.]|nr:polysaccharide biosynthesis tyrosine autokinase [Duncaniella sp.]